MGMTIGKNEKPDFFENITFDPVMAAIGSGEKDNDKISPLEEKKKKKAGFYLSLDVLARFTRKFHELKLAGMQIENKSAFVEAAILFALDDIDKGNESKVLQKYHE
ncbi:MAG: hypothetical protein C0403_01555 [Desulfobacterium sp.]|nr:hypothetical protein [Desulfobacterium sp.]